MQIDLMLFRQAASLSKLSFYGRGDYSGGCFTPFLYTTTFEPGKSLI